MPNLIAALPERKTLVVRSVQLTCMLEQLMAQDTAAALCVGRLRRNLPGPGFFMTAKELGLYAGSPDGPEAREFHQRELVRLYELYR